MIGSYPSVYAIGHNAIRNIFLDDVIIEEKVDGSQFSFGVVDGVLQCRSKGKVIEVEAPDKMFSKAVQVVLEIQPMLKPGWIYRGEYLQKPKHNTLAYDRVPDKHIIGFDVMIGNEDYLDYEQKNREFSRLGLECVPLLYRGVVSGVDMFNGFLDTISILGGSKIEGVVVKNYNQFTPEKKVSIGKYVSERFKEINQQSHREGHPTQGDIVARIVEKYKTTARWQKAVQHIKESGKLDESPKDIGLLIREVSEDVVKECGDEIKDILFSFFWKDISRGITNGLPEWYKQELAKSVFEDKNQEESQNEIP